MNILQEADKLTSGSRNLDYGHPALNHRLTSELWSAYLRRAKGDPDLFLTSVDVCMLNILQKISREANSPKRDTIVDIAGWARNIEMIAEREGILNYLPADFHAEGHNGI